MTRRQCRHRDWGDDRLPTHFWESVAPEPNSGCWLWTGPANHNDYGKTVLRGKHLSSHRKAWICLVGPVPDGMQIDHLCKNTRCCNPSHLEVVTPRENTRRSNSPTGVRARQTHCIYGHELSGNNLFFQKNGKERGCRECRRRRDKQTKARRKLAQQQLATHSEDQ